MHKYKKYKNKIKYINFIHAHHPAELFCSMRPQQSQSKANPNLCVGWLYSRTGPAVKPKGHNYPTASLQTWWSFATCNASSGRGTARSSLSLSHTHTQSHTHVRINTPPPPHTRGHGTGRKTNIPRLVSQCPHDKPNQTFNMRFRLILW